MCLAVPARIVECSGDLAVVDIGGMRRSVSVALIENPRVGDCVLLHAGFAIQKWSDADIEAYNAVMSMANEHDETT